MTGSPCSLGHRPSGRTAPQARPGTRGPAPPVHTPGVAAHPPTGREPVRELRRRPSGETYAHHPCRAGPPRSRPAITARAATPPPPPPHPPPPPPGLSLPGNPPPRPAITDPSGRSGAAITPPAPRSAAARCSPRDWAGCTGPRGLPSAVRPHGFPARADGHGDPPARRAPTCMPRPGHPAAGCSRANTDPPPPVCHRLPSPRATRSGRWTRALLLQPAPRGHPALPTWTSSAARRSG